MKAVFVELPPFERYRLDYLDDDAFLRLQRLLILNPESGDVMSGTGGCVLVTNGVGKANVAGFE